VFNYQGSNLATLADYSIIATNTSSTLIISSLKVENRGDYICNVSNLYNSHSRTTTLRVKSMSMFHFYLKLNIESNFLKLKFFR